MGHPTWWRPGKAMPRTFEQLWFFAQITVFSSVRDLVCARCITYMEECVCSRDVFAPHQKIMLFRRAWACGMAESTPWPKGLNEVTQPECINCLSYRALAWDVVIGFERTQSADYGSVGGPRSKISPNRMCVLNWSWRERKAAQHIAKRFFEECVWVNASRSISALQSHTRSAKHKISISCIQSDV